MKKVFSFLYNWGVFGLSIIVVLSYTALSTLPDAKSDVNIWSNILFVLMNLFAVFYISRQVSIWGWMNDNASNQKKIAKTAIRHNRGNLSSLLKLNKITREKISIVDDPLIKQYLMEIKNHLEMIYNGIRNSEADFNEIVNEELKEQNHLEVEISELLDQIETQKQQLTNMQDTSQSDREKIKELKHEIKKKEGELSLRVSNLPFGSNSFGTGSAYNPIITDDLLDINEIDSDVLNNALTWSSKSGKSKEQK